MKNIESIMIVFYLTLIIVVIGIFIVFWQVYHYPSLTQQVYHCPSLTQEQEDKDIKVTFEFDERYFKFFDETGMLLENYYNNKTIKLNNGYAVNTKFILDNSENFTTICVEYAIDGVNSDLDRVSVPEELYLISQEYRANCYKLPKVTELESSFLLEQEYYDAKDSIIKFTLWKI